MKRILLINNFKDKAIAGFNCLIAMFVLFFSVCKSINIVCAKLLGECRHRGKCMRK